MNDLTDYLPDEWKELLGDPDKIRDKISKFARELPAESYKVVRDAIILRMLSIDKTSSAILEFVIDANIIVKDAFRVGTGKFSSTERIFSSVFVKLYAPKSIEIANRQAKKLLSKIVLVDDSKFKVEYAELYKFQEKYGNDVSFLKVGIGMGVKNIITGDKAFDEITTVKRFELGAAVSLIVTLESGALSLSIVGDSTYIGAKAIYWILQLLYEVLAQLYAFLAMIVSAGIAGLVSVFQNIPRWVWYILFAFLAGTGIALVVSKDFREHAIHEITDLRDWISSKLKYVLEVLTNLLKGSVDIAIMFKDELGPYFMNVGFAMILSIAEMYKILKP
ncbi:MAG: hypothetical protein QXQ46_10595 [Thermoplasmatales archaeon]